MGRDERMAIGVFARATGVTTSALRFYDDCDLVRPDAVDAATGYRYYSPDQIEEVVLIRRLREAGLPLGDVRQLLAAPTEVAEELLAGHLRAMELAVEAARDNATDALALIRGRRRGVLSLPGRLLAEAIGQVTPAADRSGEIPVLGGVLIEAMPAELRLVATDRYWLAMRSIPIAGLSSRSATAVVAAEQLTGVRRWIAEQETLEVRFTPTRVRLDGPAGGRSLPTVGEEFTRYQVVLDALPDAVTRVVAPRGRLLAALGDDPTARIDLGVGEGLRIRTPSRPEITIPADITGEAAAISFRFSTLRPAVAAGVGPDVMLQIARSDLPVVVRSADDGDLTTLVMPVHPTFPDASRGAT